MITLFRTSIVTAVVTAAAITITQPALAKLPDHSNNVKTKVTFSDLDITREPGARVLLRRIKSAAIKICGGGTFPSTDLNRRRMLDACKKEAMGNAIARLNAPMVTALYK